MPDFDIYIWNFVIQLNLDLADIKTIKIGVCFFIGS